MPTITSDGFGADRVMDLGARGVSAVKWSAATTAGRFILQLIGQVLLARALGPEIYGVFGIGLLVFTFSNFLATFGFAFALLQIDDLRGDDVRFAFTWELVSGTIAGVGLYCLAPLVASYFHDPRVLPVVRWLSLACVVNAASGPSYTLLLRRMDFRATGLVDVAGYAVGYIAVGIPLAFLGAGVYSLVAAWLVQSGVRLIACLLLRPISWRPLFWYDRAHVAVSTGSTIFVTNLTNWFANNVDGLMIGRLLNARALGLYNVGYNLANAPNTMMMKTLWPTFFSACARMQHDVPRMRRAYLEVVSTVWVLVVPGFAFLALVAPDLVRFLYGREWNAAGGILSVLLLAMPFYVTLSVSTPVLWNTGRKKYEFLLSVPLLAIGVVAFYHFAPKGVQAAALVAGALIASRGLAAGVLSFRAVKLRVTDFLPHLIRGVVLCMVATGGGVVGRHMVAAVDRPLVSLVAACSGALLLVGGVLRARPALLGDHAATTVVRFAPKLRGFLKAPDRHAV
jgi:lipopolysaccharide exporter